MSQLAPTSLLMPPRTSVRVKERRRKSLPATASATKKRSANIINVQPASTDVISSLISTLSAISSPVGHHFERLPRSTPVSPRASRTDYHFPLVSDDGYVYKRRPSSPANAGVGINGSLPRHEAHEDSLSQFCAGDPILNDRAASLRRSSKDLRNTQLKARIGLEEGDEDGRSIGNVSIEQDIKSSSMSIISIAKERGRLKGMRSYKDLKFVLSDDKIREGNGSPWIGDKSQEDERAPAFPPRLRFSDVSVLSDSSAGPSNQASPIRIPKRSSSARHSIAIVETDTRSLDENTRPTSVGNGKLVPTRESSIRYSFSASRARRIRISHRSDQTSQQRERESSVDIQQEFPERELAQVMDDLVEEDEVTRRIKELKDQKRRRDQELKVATPDSRSFSRSPRLSPQPKADSVEMSQTGNAPRTPSPPDTAENIGVDAQASAPSPAISQRVDRSNGFKDNPMGTQTAIAYSVNQDVGLPRARGSPPRRSSSRLLRRLSRPISPNNAEKHRRTFSGGLSQPHSPVEERPRSRDLIDDAVQEFLTAPRLSQNVTDPQTGRVISFSEVGDPAGSAVFCCVGMGLTRYITAFYDELATTLKLRLITPDRPGVGASDTHMDALDTPLGWPDDVRAICQHLNLSKFSILAHSAGAIYALATALRMPQHIRGRIHLLAPWIPPSQMSAIGSQQEALPASALPYSQRFLRSLPATFLRAANSSWLSATSASVTSKSPRRSKHRSRDPETSDGSKGSRGESPSPLLVPGNQQNERAASVSKDHEIIASEKSDTRPSLPNRTSSRLAEKDRQSDYDTRLTEAIWDRATTGANPAVDLLVCLERRQSIGFRYVDNKKAVVIHHGSKDTRVPLENVMWLGKTMRKCEVRVLEGEGHGLMASASVMGNVLMEMAREWDDWISVTQRGVVERRVTAGT